MTSGTYPWTQIFHNGQPSHDGNRKTFELVINLYISQMHILVEYFKKYIF